MKSVRHVTNLVTVKLAASPQTMYTVPVDRRVVIRKIMAYNLDSGDNTIVIYDGSEQKLPPIVVPASSNKIVGENDLPAVEFTDSIVVAIGTDGTNGIVVVAEVEEYLP